MHPPRSVGSIFLEHEVRSKHLDFSGQRDREVGRTVTIDVRHHECTSIGAEEANLARRAGELVRADEGEGIVADTRDRVDRRQVDDILALREIGDAIST